jgi:hypothetical protein
MKEIRNVYRIFVEKPEGKPLLKAMVYVGG